MNLPPLPLALDALNDIKPDTLSISSADAEQVTRQAINWARRDSSNEDEENFSNGFIYIDGVRESARYYGEPSEGEELSTIWLDGSEEQTQIAVALAQKIVGAKARHARNGQFYRGFRACFSHW